MYVCACMYSIYVCVYMCVCIYVSYVCQWRSQGSKMGGGVTSTFPGQVYNEQKTSSSSFHIFFGFVFNGFAQIATTWVGFPPVAMPMM